MKFLIAVIFLGGLATSWKLADVRDRDHHLLCHSHDDLGWLKTIAEYYRDEVHNIFTTVLDSLDPPQGSPAAKEPIKRKFHYSEVGFLKMYINQDPAKSQERIDRIRRLIANGQWEWVNGGISQADEACPFYEDLINNFFYGQRYLKTRFGSVSKTAWQVDPFGHSNTLFYLAAKFGMTHGVFWRMDEKTRREWAKDKALQLVYQLPENQELVLHILYGYFAPESLGCDTDCDKNPLNVTRFEEDCQNNDANFRSDVIFMMGGDFQWTKAQSRFSFLEDVIRKYPTVKYSLFSEYAQAWEKKVPRNTLPKYTGDFFVYDEGANNDGDSWSGYFTTKPYLKHKIRRVGRILRTLTAWLYGPKAIDIPDRKEAGRKGMEIADISEEFGVLLHHDAITGTAKVHVDDDYLERARLIEERINELLQENTPWICDYYDLVVGKKDDCRYLKMMRKTRQILVAVFNSQPSSREGLVSVVVPKLSASQKVRVTPIFSPSKLQYELSCLPGMIRCVVYLKDSFEASAVQNYKLDLLLEAGVEVPEDFPETLQGQFVGDKGVDPLSAEGLDIEEFIRHASPVEGGIQADFSDFQVLVNETTVTYQSNDRKVVNTFTLLQNAAGDSGHYILKYNGHPKFEQFSTNKMSTSFAGRLVEGIRIWSGKAMIRLWKVKGERHYQVESLLLDQAAINEGLDITLQIGTPLIDNPQRRLWTDANGLFEVERKPNPKFENNVFPTTGWARVLGASQGLIVFNDKSQGVFVGPRSICFHLQRSATHEDHKGNEEVLKATETTFTRHVLFNHAADEDYDDAFVAITNKIDAALHGLYLPIDERHPDLPPFLRTRVLHQNSASGEEFPPQIRLLVHYVARNRALLRFQNISRKKNVKINPRKILQAWDPNFDFREVSFDYVAEDRAAEKELQDEYDLPPLAFLNIIKANRKGEALEAR